jgi:hypothetical protein
MSLWMTYTPVVVKSNRFRRLPATAERRSRWLGYMKVWIKGEAKTTA